MKIKALRKVTILATVFASLALTSCGGNTSELSNSTILVNKFCKDWLANAEKANIEPLAKAARLDPQWLGLAKSASMWSSWASDKKSVNETYGALISESYFQVKGTCEGA
jgi:hypothetical protein